MNKELIKTFSDIKSRCKTKNQRVAFNELIKSFSNGPFKAEAIAAKLKDGTIQLWYTVSDESGYSKALAGVHGRGDKAGVIQNYIASKLGYEPSWKNT